MSVRAPGRRMLGALMAMLAGCASVPIEIRTPTVAIGTLVEPRSVGWFRDICGDNRLTPSMDEVFAYPDCDPVGGVVYRMRFEGGTAFDGMPIPRGIEVALNAHGFHRAARIENVDFVLQRAPSALREASGIPWFATVFGGYDRQRRCVDGDHFPGRAHRDDRSCPDASFHSANRGRCIPIEEFLEHHREPND